MKNAKGKERRDSSFQKRRRKSVGELTAENEEAMAREEASMRGGAVKATTLLSA